ncbi:MAG TPA: DUF3800 domain-containing protein [Stellaceae bacterium]|nr:DUF3800 domain-containing protein [Stellaceae bacterium]
MGSRIVRMIFFDVAGISNPREEPWIVVAGVILHPDLQWRLLRRYLLDMTEAYVPPEHRANFAFHATELFSGGRVFPRERFPKEWRWRVLDELLSIPRRFDLPIVWGRIPRAEIEVGGRLANTWSVPPVVHGQILAFTVAAASAEHWMNAAAAPDELAQMIMENDDNSRRFFRVTQRYLSDPQIHEKFDSEYDAFKLSRIIYPMQFEDKTDSSALQVADACAFAIKRWCMKKPEAVRFYAPIRPFLVAKIRNEAWLPDVLRGPDGKQFS